MADPTHSEVDDDPVHRFGMCEKCGGIFDLIDHLPAPTPAKIETKDRAGLCGICQAEVDVWPGR